MKGLKKLVLVSAIVAAPFAQAELKAIDDATMSEMTGQSGLLIEAGFGSATYDVAAIQNDTDWTNAGITIDAFKWEVDLHAYDSATNIHDEATPTGMGGVVAEGIKIAGAVDMTVDGALDVGAMHGGIAIGFGEGSKVSMRVDAIRPYVANAAVGESMGAIEILGMDISNLDLTISGK